MVENGFKRIFLLLSLTRMVELVYTLGLGSSFLKIRVQVPFLVITENNGIVQRLEYWNHNPNVKGSNPFFVSKLRFNFLKLEYEKVAEWFKVLVC